MINYVEHTSAEEERYAALYDLGQARSSAVSTLSEVQDVARKYSSVPELQLAEQHLRIAVALLFTCEKITEQEPI